jgi:hypothetical protein
MASSTCCSHAVIGCAQSVLEENRNLELATLDSEFASLDDGIGAAVSMEDKEDETAMTGYSDNMDT